MPTARPSRNMNLGMELRGKYMLLAEGVRGSLSKEVMAKYNLSDGHEPQKFGRGMKEIWEVDPKKFKPGTVTHTTGWPLGKNARGGSYIYHLENNQVLVGFVVHLNYAKSYLSPYMEFQRIKHHPLGRRPAGGDQARGLRCARYQRGRLAVDPETDLPGSRAAGVFGRAGERAADRGQP